MDNKSDLYKKKIEKQQSILDEIKKQYNLISIARLVVVISFIAFMYLMDIKENILYAFILGVLHLVLFIYLAKIHEGVSNKRQKAQNLIIINTNEMKRLDGEWKQFEDCGNEYLDLNHNFINDLDIFGKNSLFQWINITNTSYGRKKLSENIRLNTLPSKDEIVKSQEFIKELGDKLDFRQKFIEALMPKKIKEYREEFLINWVKDKNEKLLSNKVKAIKYLMPSLTIASIIACIFGITPWSFLILILLIDILVLKSLSKEVLEGLQIFEELKYKIKTYVVAIELVENENFHSEYGKKLKAEFLVNELKASSSLKELEKITMWLYDRGNAFYILFNAIFMWDYKVLYNLELWRRKYGENFNGWMEVIGEFEAKISLASIRFNNPNWCMPEISESMEMECLDVAHPMLLDKAVSNSFKIKDNKRVLLITGSNMSGKSTFLRTIGFNTILAYLGLCVNAKEFKLPILNVYTCMRTGDNLEESISSFYAEILRVKKIVEGCERKENILFLLDEIFKGTNSIDRHLGAEVLIKQLLKGNSIGFVSTHDLELCDMEKSSIEIGNYNFREYYKDNKLMFDYKLREGVSKTRNARYLMKMAGIDID